MPDPSSGNGTTPTNGTNGTNGTRPPAPEDEEEEAAVDISEINPDDTAQLNVENLRALLGQAKLEAQKNVKATRLAVDTAKIASETRQFKTGGFSKKA